MQDRRSSRAELEGLVVGVELTLISVVAGVVLSFLISAASPVLVSWRVADWVYVGTGLLLLFLFWSRAVVHTFTLIRWPIEYGHNFLYMTSALLQAVMIGQIGNVELWFATGSAVAASSWLLFAYDLRLIRQRLAGANGPIGADLLRQVHDEQWTNVKIGMPVAVAFHAACFLATRIWPGLFGVAGGLERSCGFSS
jgi:hypothetical protein